MRYLLPDAPPVRGAIKVEPEDFEVEEIPTYLPSGEGDHLYLWIEKRGCTTQETAEVLARVLGLGARDVGYAGQKDRQAVTRQWFSVLRTSAPGGADAPDTPIALPDEARFRILQQTPHRNKLKNGHLIGNRFWIRIRGGGADTEAARTLLEDLRARGVPNYYGEQRFGRDAGNPDRGRQVLKGELRPKRYLRKLYLSALQSELFNAWLDARIDDGLFATAITGDLLQPRGGHGVFLCEDPGTDQSRVDSGEVDPTGPIFGRKMRLTEGPAAPREQAILEAAGLTIEDFGAGGRDTLGTRRAARVGLTDLEIETEGEDLRLAFTLPRGAYATVVLGQVLR